MNPLLKKEIRLVLPAWLAILTLGMGLPWFGKDQDTAVMTAPFFFFLGMVLLAVDSFGREFSLGTFSGLMSQPLERQQVWRTKISVLLIAATMVFAVFFLSCELRLHRQFAALSMWHTFGFTMAQSGLALLVALAGGLWTALLLRQTAAAFWIALLAPAGLLMLVIFATSFLFKSRAGWLDDAVLFIAAGIYVPAAFWFAHWLFHRAEDAGWTGGVISFSNWRYFEGAKAVVKSRRQWRPAMALLRKEFQLHSVSLLGAGVLLGLQGLVFLTRTSYSEFHPNSTTTTLTDYFWCLWLVLPLATGCMSVAEERKLAVTDALRCLPVSPRRQYFLKLFPVLFLGVLLGGVMPLLLEGVAAKCGNPGVFFREAGHYPMTSTLLAGEAHLPVFWFRIDILGLAAGLAWTGFFASTYARNFLQALSIAALMLTGTGFAYALTARLGAEYASLFETIPLPWLLAVLMGIPTLAGAIVWLSYRNFIAWQEPGRMWWRTAAVFLKVGIFIVASSALIYNRVWDLFEPVEPPHGAAKFTIANAPRLQGSEFYGDLQVLLPDGRVWCDSLEEFYWKYAGQTWKQIGMFLVERTPNSGGPQAFMGGSNWIAAATSRVHFHTGSTNMAGNLDTAGIRADGTLWISRDSQPGGWTGAHMIQFGSETHWRQVEAYGANFLLLKSDGTIWQWGTNNFDYNQWQTNWPTARNLQPRQIGTNSDWQEIFSINADYFRKKDGSVWECECDRPGANLYLVSQPNLSSVDLKTYNGLAYVGRDGSLWFRRQWMEGTSESRFLRVGQETSWLDVDTSANRMVALRQDGTLWQWDLARISEKNVTTITPRQLGIHNDWVALHSGKEGTVSLAADGSLWLWPDWNSPGSALVKPPKQPKLLGNVLAAN